MRALPGFKLISALSPFAKINDFREIQNFNLYRSGSTFLLNLGLSACLDNRNMQIEIICEGISSCRLQLPGHALESFHIECISDRGWENKNWELLDYESDCFHAYAKSVEIIKAHF